MKSPAEQWNLPESTLVLSVAVARWHSGTFELPMASSELQNHLWLSRGDLRRVLCAEVSDESLGRSLDARGLPLLPFGYFPAEVQKAILERFPERAWSSMSFVRWADFLPHLILSEQDFLAVSYLSREQLRSVPRFLRPPQVPLFLLPVEEQPLWRSAFFRKDHRRWYRYQSTVARFHPSFARKHSLATVETGPEPRGV